VNRSIYIVRHGAAVDIGEQGVSSDAEKHLSSAGTEKTEEAAKGLASLGVVPDLVATSPLVRAKQTAEIIARITGCKRKMEILEFLAPGGSIPKIVKCLRNRSAETLLLVGHMPDLAELGSFLLTGNIDMDMTFKKASVLHVSYEDRLEAGTCRLEWLLQPRMLRKWAHDRRRT
jgi:phosphohistidine phosphatase